MRSASRCYMQVKCYADGCGEIGEPLINNRNQTRCRFCYSINVAAATERDIAQDAERKRQRAAKQQALNIGIKELSDMQPAAGVIYAVSTETDTPIIDSPVVETVTPIVSAPV